MKAQLILLRVFDGKPVQGLEHGNGNGVISGVWTNYDFGNSILGMLMTKMEDGTTYPLRNARKV